MMWSLFSNIIRASSRSSIQYRKCAYQVCCVRQYSRPSDHLPNLPTDGTGLPPVKRPDLPFVTIYDQFPHALQMYKLDNSYMIATISSAKRILLPAGVVFLTYAIGSEIEDTMDHDTVVACSVGVALFVGSYLSMTIPMRNFVGFLYVDQETEEIIVSYVDFWGSRIDEKFEPGDLYFEARNNFLDKLFIFLISRKTGERFRINMRHANVFSQELLEKNISQIPDSAF